MGLLEQSEREKKHLLKRIGKKNVPEFHLFAPGGWLNDPNGFSEYKGRYHLFFQYHPYSTNWGPMHWGHSTTRDFLHWKTEKIALAPDENFDDKGCFSGTALSWKGKHIIAYTGVYEKNGLEIQSQCIALGNGKKYKKLKENPVITSENIPFEYDVRDFRDPKIWMENNRFYLAAVVRKKDSGGALVVFKSRDLKKWDFVSVAVESRNKIGSMWECPDIFRIGKKTVFIVSPMEMEANKKRQIEEGSNSIYFIGNFTQDKEFLIGKDFLKNGGVLLDYGIDFYAPQTMQTSDGRTVLVAWLASWNSIINPPGYLWQGMMCLPREIKIKHNRIIQKPVREIKKIRKEKKQGCIPISANHIHLDGIYGRKFELKLVFKSSLPADRVDYFEINIGNKIQNVRLSVRYNFKQKNAFIKFDRKNSITRQNITNEKEVYFPLKKGFMELRCICDYNSIEVFIQKGTHVFSNIYFLPEECVDVSFVNSSPETVDYSYYRLGKS